MHNLCSACPLFELLLLRHRRCFSLCVWRARAILPHSSGVLKHQYCNHTRHAAHKRAQHSLCTCNSVTRRLRVTCIVSPDPSHFSSLSLWSWRCCCGLCRCCDSLSSSYDICSSIFTHLLFQLIFFFASICSCSLPPCVCQTYGANKSSAPGFLWDC